MVYYIIEIANNSPALLMKTTQTRITTVAQSIAPATIANRIYHAKECGYKMLQLAIRELRDLGAIVIKERLNCTKVELEALADAIVAECDELSKSEEIKKLVVDDDRTLRCRLHKDAIVDNREAMKMGHSETDIVSNIWSMVKRRDVNTIRLIPNGFDRYTALAGDAIVLVAYFDRPLFTRTIVTKTGTFVLAATVIDSADAANYKLLAQSLGKFRIEIELE